MKLKIKHFDAKVFEKKMEHLKDINFTLFMDDIPTKPEDSSEINILVLQEPDEYFGLHNWAIENSHYFSFILTWDEKVLNNTDNSMFLPFGHTWFKPENYNKKYNKKLKISHLAGKLNKTYGHGIRHEVLGREKEITKIPTKFHHTYGDRYDINNARQGKIDVFSDSMFAVAIENTSHKGYFTEKILDLFLLKTIPIYWGCSNIGKFFNTDGIIQVQNADDIISVSNTLDKDVWINSKEAIEDNWNRALNFVDYEQNIVDQITNIFEHNGILEV
jgi:hypothetical protein|tara:strand:+ start:382 stop:1203 length:822 start_codon:yes stop_codon:yes gene_type:complete